MAEVEKIRLYRSFFYPAMFVVLLWIIRGADYFLDLGLNEYGLYPLEAKGLIGIFTSPFLHADTAHLFANSIPLLILGAFLFYFYKELAWQVLIWLMIITGFWVWTFARGGAAHIGASGIIYGLASFLIFSGMIRREKSLMVLTLLVTFLYGGLIWGVFPQFFPNKPISWESHGMGFLAGLVLSVYYRNQGPQRKKHDWEEEDEISDDENAYWRAGTETDNTENKPAEPGISGQDEDKPSSANRPNH
jgi:membrane associated rhomboid family serine protease